MTTKQLMEILQVDRTTIYRMMNDGRLPSVRVGGQWRFSRKAIDEWLNQQNPSSPVESRSVSAAPSKGILLDSNVLPISCLQPIQEIFAQTSDVGAVTTDLSGNPIIAISNSCSFCNLILSTEKGRAKCHASWQKLAHQNDLNPRLEKCHAGLAYARGRIMAENQFVAMFFVGQFVVDKAKSMRIKTHLTQVAHDCGVDENELTKMAQDIRVLDKARADRLLGLLRLVAQTFSSIAQERTELLTRLKRVAEIVKVEAS